MWLIVLGPSVQECKASDRNNLLMVPHSQMSVKLQTLHLFSSMCSSLCRLKADSLKRPVITKIGHKGSGAQVIRSILF